MTETTYEALLEKTIDIMSSQYHREITETTQLSTDLNLDSVDTVELVAAIEDHFDVVIPVENLPGIRTVGDIALALAQLMNDGSGVRGA